ncbi:MAG: hypothetical protein ACXQTS_07635 [Candidatus Methanospirareceae archaeon]
MRVAAIRTLPIAISEINKRKISFKRERTATIMKRISVKEVSKLSFIEKGLKWLSILIELQNLKLEKCPFRDIVDSEVLRKFVPPGSAGFCIDLIRCNLYRYKEYCKCVRYHEATQNLRSENDH